MCGSILPITCKDGADLISKFIFIIAVALLFYTFAGYPLLLWMFALLRPRHVPEKRPEHLPSVSIIMAVRNESNVINERINNLLDCEYPVGKVEIIVVSDGSTDDTAQKIKTLALPSVILVELPEPKGKAFCVNTARARASGELLVFTDARQAFRINTLMALASDFSDPALGAVSGELIISPSCNEVGRSIGAYWEYEKKIRLLESMTGSSVGCTGAVYAARASLVHDIPEDTLLDDLVIPMQIAVAGYNVGFNPEAQAFDPQPLDPENEKHRKARTLAGNFQAFFRYPAWLLPWQNRLWWRLISHKYLRLLTPVMCVSALLASACPQGFLFPFYFAAQLLFYIAAFTGIAFPCLRYRMVGWPAAFVFMNSMIIKGFWYYIRRDYKSGWKRA